MFSSSRFTSIPLDLRMFCEYNCLKLYTSIQELPDSNDGYHQMVNSSGQYFQFMRLRSFVYRDDTYCIANTTAYRNSTL